MEQYKDFFKNRAEVNEYFKNDTFKFHYMSDNTIFFDSLVPLITDDGYYHYEVSFYFEEGYDFFCYAQFNDWFDQFQLSEVLIKNELTKETETMFFKKYQNK